MKKGFPKAAILFLLFFVVHTAFGAVATSSNYRIQFDSVNVGGLRSTSSSFTIEDTVGEIATGISTSSSFTIRAGYQQMNAVLLSITSPADISMSPAIPGISGGTSNGSAAWTVTTDAPAGYSLAIRATGTPAMQQIGGSDDFANYTPAGGDPDFTFSVAVADAEFAYTPEGTNITQRFQDDGGSCNAGSSDAADSCWDGLSTSNVDIAGATSANHPGGTETTVKFRAESGANHQLSEGTYQATIVLTATAL